MKALEMLNGILCFFQAIDLREIFYAVFGSFFGFGLTILLEKKSEKKNKKEIMLRALKNIELELREIVSAISATLDDQQSKLIIDTPIYESLLRSGSILIFIEEDYYSELIETYALIKYLHEREVDMTIGSDEKTIIRKNTQKRIYALLHKFPNSNSISTKEIL